MAYDEITALLGGWEGFELTGVQRESATETDPVPRIVLELRPLPDYPKRCSRCGEVVVEIHDVADHARRAIALDPGDAAAHAALGYIALNYEWDWEIARIHMDRALSLAPNDSFVLNRAAMFHVSLDRLDLAFTLAERSLIVDPMSAYAHLFAALVLNIGGKAQRAMEVAESGWRMHAEHVDLMRILGVAYTYAGRLNDAIHILSEAAVNSNRQTTVVGHLAVAHARRGDIDHANALLDELLRRSTTEIVHSRVIGLVLMELGRIDEAFVRFNQAFEIENGLWLCGESIAGWSRSAATRVGKRSASGSGFRANRNKETVQCVACWLQSHAGGGLTRRISSR